MVDQIENEILNKMNDSCSPLKITETSRLRETPMLKTCTEDRSDQCGDKNEPPGTDNGVVFQNKLI